MAEIEVLHPGLFSTIQDEGRFGFRKYGVPVSGAMDQHSAALANLLLQNDPGAAVLEITLQGPHLKFSEDTQIVITGARLSPLLEGNTLENNHIYSVKAGQSLKFGKRISGYRAYLAVKHGFASKEILESRSWCPGITPHHRLEKGMKLGYQPVQETSRIQFSAVKQDGYFASEVIKVYPGPEYELLNDSEKKAFKNYHFSVGRDSNRMGIQFEQKLQNSLEPIITGPVLPGTVQLTPSGILIALMRDGQTTGGYPRIFQISEVGMDVLAQKLPGEKIQLKLINYN